MRHIILFVALVLISNGAYAQAAALTIDNHSDVCTAYVNVRASDANLSNPLACDIQTCTIVLPPLTTAAFTDPLDVYTSTSYPAGICGAATGFTAGMLAAELASASPQWIWTDATIQFDCPSMPCTEGGCLLSGNVCVAAPTPCFQASGASILWTASVCNPTLSHVDWLPSTTYCFMTDIVIDIW